ncbi:hypothetical protein SISNIDRAFT_463203 [Sistotremastrum niveocremeum HHB9708]|uniref:Uncharacterized protein n=1 Tax=Sistotremastrum niveocremeum HHB9708 TaxID=1314777 RepID=A0A164YVP4_9AGAM|nr:hypothetical protein SISNIDRAFT_463203 [Sistotremastrum niveocremeum HHB9708]
MVVDAGSGSRKVGDNGEPVEIAMEVKRLVDGGVDVEVRVEVEVEVEGKGNGKINEVEGSRSCDDVLEDAAVAEVTSDTDNVEVAMGIASGLVARIISVELGLILGVGDVTGDVNGERGIAGPLRDQVEGVVTDPELKAISDEIGAMVGVFSFDGTGEVVDVDKKFMVLELVGSVLTVALESTFED